MFMHVKVCCLATKNHPFGPNKQSQSIDIPKFSGGNPLDPPSCCDFVYYGYGPGLWYYWSINTCYKRFFFHLIGQVHEGISRD